MAENPIWNSILCFVTEENTSGNQIKLLNGILETLSVRAGKGSRAEVVEG